jgi:hypothetical protein
LRGLDLAAAAHALDQLAARDGGSRGGCGAGLAATACQYQAQDSDDQNNARSPLHENSSHHSFSAIVASRWISGETTSVHICEDAMFR